MSGVLVAILGYGDRTPNAEVLGAICESPGIVAMTVVWHCPGPGVAAALQELRSRCANLSTELSDSNPGSAGGYARLLEKAAGMPDWEHLLLLDDDLDASPETIVALAMASKSLPGDGSVLLMAYRRELSELRALVEQGRHLRDIRPGACIGFHMLNFLGFGGRHSSKMDSGSILLESAPYGGLFIPRASLARLGLPIKELFLYADDAEWTLRFTSGGGSIRLVANAPLKDRFLSWNATESAGGNLTRRILHLGSTKAYYEARNRNFLARKYYPGHRLAYAVNRTLFLAATYLVAATTRKLSRARLIRRAILDGETMAGVPPHSWPSPPPGLD